MDGEVQAEEVGIAAGNSPAEEAEDDGAISARGLPSPVDVFEGHVTPPSSGTATPPLPDPESQLEFLLGNLRRGAAKQEARPFC